MKLHRDLHSEDDMEVECGVYITPSAIQMNANLIGDTV